MGGFTGSRRFPRSSWPVRYSGLAAVAGGALVGIGASWLFLSSTVLVNVPGSLSGFFRLAGPVGVALTTASLFGVYALLLGMRSGVGIIVGAPGALIALLSVASVGWIIVHQPPLASPVVQGASSGPPPFLAVAAVVVGLARPVGILLLAVAALLARAGGIWKYLLLVLAVLETIFFANLPYYFLGPAVVAGWPVLLFGIPGVQSGLIGSAFWMLLGYALVRAARKAGRWRAGRRLR